MTMLNMELFAKRLREARTKKGLTQKELAQITGISGAMLSAYESTGAKAGKNPTLATAYTLANCLDVSIDWLCGNDSVAITDDTEIILSVLMKLIFSDMRVNLNEEYFQYEAPPVYQLMFDLEHNSYLYDFLNKTTELKKFASKGILPPYMLETLKRTYIDEYKDIPWEIMTFKNEKAQKSITEYEARKIAIEKLRTKEGDPHGNDQETE